MDETESHWAISYVHHGPLFEDGELRFYWFLSEDGARKEFQRASTAHPNTPIMLIKKSGDHMHLVEINGPRFDLEGRA